MNEQYHFFWGKESLLSNFSPHSVYMPAFNMLFATSEHAYMYFKAKFFGDTEAMRLIFETADPGKAKKIGRAVKNFDEGAWSYISYDVMVQVLRAKFLRVNNDFCGRPANAMHVLADTWPLHLVEASPYDKIWGIGLSEADAKVTDPTLWPGSNLLGKALEEVRDEILRTAR